MKFESGNEMYEYLCSGRDLYSRRLGIYAFEYNDAHAICIYYLQPEEVVELIKKSKETGEYWGGHLGWGGSILEDPDYDDDEHRYHEDEAMRNLYLRLSLEFCDEMYVVDDWMNTDDVTIKSVMEEK